MEKYFVLIVCKYLIFTIQIFCLVSKFPKVINVIYSFILLVLYQLFFSEYGNDYKVYEDFYNRLDNVYNFESGFVLLNKYVSSLDISFVVFYTLLNSITLVILFSFIYKRINNVMCFIIPYTAFIFYSLQINAIRQSIAVLIFILSIDFIIKRKLLNYVFFILIASFFHRSIFIMLPFYWVFNARNISDKYIIISFVVALSLYIFRIDIISYPLNFILGLLNYDIILNKFDFYEVVNSLNESFFGIGFIERIFLFIFLFYMKVNYCRNIGCNDYKNKMFLVCYVIGVLYILFQLVFFDYNIFFQRIKFYFLPFIYLMFAIYLEKKELNNINKNIVTAIFMSYCLANIIIKTY
ncbi:EpsG family protein [Photobacterium damselae]|uniref:EpsG family protein n=1 Tax=Photobacterium damselae TaxID=38293 RepID=UPI0015A4656B|nr:EpsG family protein [Photobacterium damselae]NVO60955.1 EpsG family protein [Photobacterium damselae subsp. damselae]